jgi:M6 family metalloprotease-like protein
VEAATMTLLAPRRIVFLTLLALGAMPPALAAETVHKGIVVLVQFPDVRHQIDRSMVQARFSRHLNAYVREMSYNQVSLQVDVTRTWYTLPEPVSRYRISSRNLGVDKSRVSQLIDDALRAADAEVDFEDYAFAVVFMGARVADYGMVGLCGFPGMLGWSTTRDLRTKSGNAVRGGVAIFTSQAHLGTLFHDVAHILGGVKDGKRMVPCLYDHDLQARPGPMRETFVDATINLGFWDPMSCHYYRRQIGPPGLTAWTKLRLGWLDSSKVSTVKAGERTEVLLGPLEEGRSSTLVVKIPLSRTTYYLVENRQPIGFDQGLPGSGVLIMYADDEVAECRHGQAPVKLVNANPSIPHLEGAAFDVATRASFQDDKRGVTIRLLEKTGGAYKVLVDRAGK